MPEENGARPGPETESRARGIFSLAPDKTQCVGLSSGETGKATTEVTGTVPGWTKT